MTDLRQKVQDELDGKTNPPGKSRDSKILPFVLIVLVVFGLMFAFLYYANQNATVGTADQTNTQPY